MLSGIDTLSDFNEIWLQEPFNHEWDNWVPMDQELSLDWPLLGNMSLDIFDSDLSNVLNPVSSSDTDMSSDDSSASDTDAADEIPKRIQNRTSPNISHWLFTMIEDPKNKQVINWIDKEEGVFKVLEPKVLANLWEHRPRKARPKNKMTYENLA